MLSSRSDPFLPMDPPHFGDHIPSDTERPLHSFRLPSQEGWEWELAWAVDVKTGIVGKSIDKGGWDYAFDFADLLNPEIPRRGNNQTMDCVRRRRWTRTRVREIGTSSHDDLSNTNRNTNTNPSANRSSKDKSYPLESSQTSPLEEDTNTNCAIIWDIVVKETGQKIITLRSGLIIVNTLPYEVKLKLQDGTTLGPIQENGTLSIPLQKMKYTHYIRVQPTRFTKEWSGRIPCGSRSVDFSEQIDVSVSILPETEHANNNHHGHDYNEHTLPIRSLVCQQKDSITVTLYPHVEIINALPCAMHFKIAKSYKDLKNHHIIDQHLMNAGDSCKLYFVNVKENNFISLCLPGPYGWSEPVDLKKMVDKKGRVNVIFNSRTDSGEIALLIRLQVHLKAGSISSVEVFSNSAFVDYTGLDIAISSVVNKKTGEKIKRISYNQDITDIQRESESESGGGNAATRHASSAGIDIDIDIDISIGIISNLVVKSRLAYKALPRAAVGVPVHTDRDYHFSYLPKFLQNQAFIQTAGNDRVLLLEGSSFLQFQVDTSATATAAVGAVGGDKRGKATECLVVLLIDIRVTQLPPWLLADGFHLIRGERVVAIGKSFSNHSMELNYNVYGKCFPTGSVVSLGCDFSTDARNMYSVFVVPCTGRSSSSSSSNNTSDPEGMGAAAVVENLTEVLAQVHHASSCSASDTSLGAASPTSRLADMSWVAGGHGCTLFNTETGRVTVGVKRGKVWAKQEINLRGLDSTSRKNGPFEVCVVRYCMVLYVTVKTIKYIVLCSFCLFLAIQSVGLVLNKSQY